MKVSIEMRQIVPASSGGIVQLLQGVLTALFEKHTQHQYYVFTTIFNRNLFPKDYPHVKYFSLPTSTFFQEVDRIISLEQIPILFRSYPMVASLNFPLQRQIFFIPDVQHERFPQFFAPDILKQRQQAFNQALAWGGAIGTITEFARQEILDLPVTRCKDVFIMEPSLQTVLGQEEDQLDAEEKALLPQVDYFYFPANLWPHKNHIGTLKAFERMLHKVSTPVELILTGQPNGWEELKAQFPTLPVRHLGFVKPQLVQALLKHANALVFFSLYEGFGMPLLEAFAAGTPVICSNTTALQEVGGDAVLSCAPDDVEAMSDLMARILQEPQLGQILAVRGAERLKLFSWERSAAALNLAFERVDRQADIQLADLPLVSIVTPSYNQGEYIRDTIESVLNQTYKNIEYHVIDGGSTDQTIEILKSYGDHFSWISEPDRGQTHAINKGFALSHGEILAYLNSDDVLEPDAVEKAVVFFISHPGIDLVYGRAYLIDKAGIITGFYNTADYSFKRLMFDNCICQPAAFWRREIAERCGPFDESLHFSMDYEYWMRLDRAGGKLFHIPDILARSRLYAETKTLSSREKIFQEIFTISERHAEFIDLNYFYGLWNHRVWEQDNERYRWLRLLPRSFIFSANIHWLWHHRHKLTLKKGIQGLFWQIKVPLRRLFGFLRPINRALLARKFKVDAQKPVFGLWDDNCIGPVFQVFLNHKIVGEKFYIKGIPAQTTTVRVKEDGRRTHTLKANAGEEICIEFAANEKQRVQITFSNPVKDEKGRFSAFRITDTNLFSEGDADL